MEREVEPASLAEPGVRVIPSPRSVEPGEMGWISLV